ncbi:hypothetical protein G9A89_008930 [Geosiphon pyriformis]|nr:hypothetical protein G9A89_008930 [Geosiphon pyriformis]
MIELDLKGVNDSVKSDLNGVDLFELNINESDFYHSPSGSRVKRPPNRFLVFRMNVKNIVQGRNLSWNKQMRIITSVASQYWKESSIEKRKPFIDIAEKVKKHHNKSFPNYAYKPLKKKTEFKEYIPQNTVDNCTDEEDEKETKKSETELINFKTHIPSTSLTTKEASISNNLNTTQICTSNNPNTTPITLPIPFNNANNSTNFTLEEAYHPISNQSNSYQQENQNQSYFTSSNFLLTNPYIHGYDVSTTPKTISPQLSLNFPSQFLISQLFYNSQEGLIDGANFYSSNVYNVNPEFQENQEFSQFTTKYSFQSHFVDGYPSCNVIDLPNAMPNSSEITMESHNPNFNYTHVGYPGESIEGSGFDISDYFDPLTF